jgi:restriction system protein
MTATHNPAHRTRKTSTRTRRRTMRLPRRLEWQWVALAIAVFGIAKTWPVITALAVVLLAIGLVIAARQPAWLQRATRRLPAIHFNRTRLPARGHRTLDLFLRMHHDEFEHAIAVLARQHRSVRTATKSGGTGDRGLDVLVQLRNGHRILIQCKHYAPGRNNVSGPDVREIVGSVIAHRCDYGAIVTTSDFTPEAYDTNDDLGRNRLTLINGARLVEWANGGRPPWA